jgi:hypothetical protein
VDLWVEVWRNAKWIFLAIILRRPYLRSPDEDRFDIWAAMNGTREYAILDVPQENGGEEVEYPLNGTYSNERGW